MKNNKHQVMELFFYILIVIVGLVLLFMSKAKEPVPPNDAISPPPAQTDVQNTEKGETNAVIFDRQG